MSTYLQWYTEGQVIAPVFATLNMAADRGLSPTEVLQQGAAALALFADTHGLDLVVAKRAVDDIQEGVNAVGLIQNVSTASA